MASLAAAARIGVISDTHGLLRPEAVQALGGSQFIIHAGDIGDPEILPQLNRLAPVTAVRGNIDRFPWARNIPAINILEVGGLSLYVLHNLAALDLEPQAAGFAAVICGHSHIPRQETRNGVLYLNPGSAGPTRFQLRATVARLTIRGGRLSSDIIELRV
jgi:putative phosphoesterase